MFEHATPVASNRYTLIPFGPNGGVIAGMKSADPTVFHAPSPGFPEMVLPVGLHAPPSAPLLLPPSVPPLLPPPSVPPLLLPPELLLLVPELLPLPVLPEPLPVPLLPPELLLEPLELPLEPPLPPPLLLLPFPVSVELLQ